MKRFHFLPSSVQKSLELNSLIKIISGLNNFDPSSVKSVSKAAGIGKADLLDIACDPNLVSIAKESSSGLPVCVSAVEPHLFIEAVKAGADMIEIGNFDSFYPQGRVFGAKEVLALTAETRSLLPDTPLSVTVPHILPLHEQAELAIDLVHSGADIIQTEGGVNANPINPGSLGLIEKAAPTLAATYSIVERLREAECLTPVITASGLSSVTVPMAISVGASGVGIGSAVNRLNNELAMVSVIKSIRQSIESLNISNRQIV